MNDVMVDIETLSTGTRAAIVSIGAVKFDLETGELGEEFYRRVDLVSYNVYPEFYIDLGTLKWWLQQADGPRLELVKPGTTINGALLDFGNWIDRVEDKVWANGSMFDNRILFDAYHVVGLDTPWHYRNDRDMRTLTDLTERLGVAWDPPEAEGTEHNALADAKNQARAVVAMYQAINAHVKQRVDV